MNVEITPAELAAMLKLSSEGTPLLLDVREQWEWDLAHLPGSVHIPMHLVPLRHNELPDDKPIVTICHHGVRSLQVASFLRNAGFEDVASLHGGLDAWSSQVDPSIRRY
jgi:rhodanese-related sulfurtransferase